MDTYKKTIDGNLEVTHSAPAVLTPGLTEVNEYNLTFLREQKVRAAEDLANVIAQHAVELSVAQDNINNIDKLLFEANKLNIL